jgi:hypothetical protein
VLFDQTTARSRLVSGRQDAGGIYGVTVGKMSRSPGLPVNLHFGIITKAKTPVVQVLAVPTDAERVTAMIESVAAIWKAIQVGDFYPSPRPHELHDVPVPFQVSGFWR